MYTLNLYNMSIISIKLGKKATEKISWSPLAAARVTLCVKAFERPECWGLTIEWGQKEGEAMKTVGRREGGWSRKERIIVLLLLKRRCQMPASNIRDLVSKGHRCVWERWDQDSQQVSSKLSTLLLCRAGPQQRPQGGRLGEHLIPSKTMSATDGWI